MRNWSIEGDPAVAKRYHITDKGLLYKVFGDDDLNIFIRNTISDFKKTYITDKMTEHEKNYIDPAYIWGE